MTCLIVADTALLSTVRRHLHCMYACVSMCACAPLKTHAVASPRPAALPCIPDTVHNQLRTHIMHAQVHYGMSSSWDLAVYIANVTFVGIFAAEVALKWVSE